MNLFRVLRRIARGQTLLRVMMNESFGNFTLKGKVVDVGGGRSPDYFDYFKKENMSSIEAVDGSISGIDFETDRLPYGDGSVDTVLCANVLEHVYDYKHLTSEIHRILKPGGLLIGFVPFLINYHPDPHDYFRYTSEALGKMLEAAGFVDAKIETVGRGPFAVNYNNIVLSVPVFLRLLIFPIYSVLDSVFLKLRPEAKKRYPLGYVFGAGK